MALQITNQETKESTNTMLESSQKLLADCAKLVKSNESIESETGALRGSNDRLKISLQKQVSFISSLVTPSKERPSEPSKAQKDINNRRYYTGGRATSRCRTQVSTLPAEELLDLVIFGETKITADHSQGRAQQEVKSQCDYQPGKLKSQYDAQPKDFKSKDQSLEEQINSIMSSQQIRGSTTLLDYPAAALQVQKADEWHAIP
ncbi:hypothetical protein ACHAPI_007941 [Fusarium lateritium]